jgi:hypothetical protein
VQPGSSSRISGREQEASAERRMMQNLRIFCRRCSVQSVLIGNFLQKLAASGCIPESFVARYAVNFAPVAALPGLDTRSVQHAAPIRRDLRQSATLTWRRSFIAARISSPDSQCSWAFFLPGWRLPALSEWPAHLTQPIRTLSARSRYNSATSITPVTTALIAVTVIPALKPRQQLACRRRKPA